MGQTPERVSMLYRAGTRKALAGTVVVLRIHSATLVRQSGPAIVGNAIDRRFPL